MRQSKLVARHDVAMKTKSRAFILKEVTTCGVVKIDTTIIYDFDKSLKMLSKTFLSVKSNAKTTHVIKSLYLFIAFLKTYLVMP